MFVPYWLPTTNLNILLGSSAQGLGPFPEQIFIENSSGEKGKKVA